MPINAKITLAIAFALSLIVTGTTAATRSHRVHPGTRTYPASAHETIITNQCLPTDDPCRTKPDGW
ncbi:MAG TPA: hypothetical protein VH206_08970 [Xanthobacteraceae bacterium]|jgi:hypothetical protein|nr:hypothetical protein [Xanthobacteraceae bacterium]